MAGRSVLSVVNYGNIMKSDSGDGCKNPGTERSWFTGWRSGLPLLKHCAAGPSGLTGLRFYD